MGAAAGLVALSGCTTYHPRPLTSDVVEKALEPPSAEVLKVDAAAIRHPLLKPVALNVEDGLSPDEAAIVAVLLNPGLRAERAARGLADAQVIQARVLPNPTLTGAMDFPRHKFERVPSSSSASPSSGSSSGGSSSGMTTGTTAGNGTQGTTGSQGSGSTTSTDTSGMSTLGRKQQVNFNAYNVGLSWEITGLINWARIRSAKYNAKSVALDIAYKEWQVAEAAKTAVYDLVALREQAVLAREMDGRLEENLDLVKRAVDQQLMTELDLTAAQTASNQAHANLLSLQQQVAQQEITLNRLLGLPPTTLTQLQEDIELPSACTVPPLDALLDGIEQKRLDLVALQWGYQSQEQAVLDAVWGQFPKIVLGASHARDTSKVVTTGFDVGIDLPIFDRNQGAIASERAKREQLYQEYINRVFETHNDVAGIAANIQSLNEQIKTAEEAEPQLQHLVDTYRTAVDQGQADVLSYYTAWNDLTQKRLDIVGLKQQLMSNRIALELATGRYSVETSQ